jgi:hypothetical protein
MLLFYARALLRDGALKSGLKACRERPTVKEKAASPSTLRPTCDEGNPTVHLVSDLGVEGHRSWRRWRSRCRVSGWRGSCCR